MTLVLTVASPRFVVQASDRRLTLLGRSEAKPFDPFANKTIVYRATDAVVTLGYAGLAYVGDQPTDEWLAELLWGQPIPRGPDGRTPAGFGTGRSANQWNIGQAVQAVADAIERSVPPEHALQITIAGWRGKRERTYPIAIEIEKHPGVRTPEIRRQPRFWPRDTNVRWFSIGVDIDGKELRDRFDPYRRGEPFLPERVEEVFARFIRDTSARDPGVGPDVLTVVLSKPGYGLGGCRFHTAERLPAKIETPSRVISVDGVAHTPWIISGGSIRAPSADIGEFRMGLGGYEFVIKGGEPRGGLMGLSTSLTRPRHPGVVHDVNRRRA